MDLSKPSATATFFDKIIFYSYSALFFFVPLILTPWTSELFEFNKMVFVYLLTIIIVWAWVCKMIMTKKIIFRRTFWDIPLLLFLTSQIISTIFSIDRHTSLFGYYSRFNGGLFSTICYLVLYWGLVSNLKFQISNFKFLRIILFSGFLVSLYGIAEHFGIDKNIWIQDVQNRVFSTLGQPNWLAAYLDILIFLVLSFLVDKNRSQNRVNLTTYYVLYSTYYIVLLFTKSRSGFLGFIIPFAIFASVNLALALRSKTKQLLGKLGVIFVITIILSLAVGTPIDQQTIRLKKIFNFSFLSDVNTLSEQNAENDKLEIPNGKLLITPSSDIRKIVWKGAISLWKKYPLFGAGVETFAYSYYWARPVEHNLTSEWDFLYNKAHNEFLNLAANTGALGLITYLLLIFSSFIFAVKNFKKTSNPLLPATCYMLPSIAITNFFGFSVVPVALLFFLLPAILLNTNFTEANLEVTASLAGDKRSLRTKSAKWCATLLALFLIAKVLAYWLADYHFSKGDKLEKANFLELSLKHLDLAVLLNGIEPNFYSQRAITLSKIAASSAKEEVDQSILENLAAQAIADSQKALKISPYHLNFYKNQAKVFYYLAFVETKYLRMGLQTMLDAEKIAPTEAKITYNIGLMYQTLGDNIRAKEYFEKTLFLKPNYDLVQEALEKLKQ